MKPSKIFQVTLVLFSLLSTTLAVHPALGESVPSVPQFTLQFINGSYTIPPTYSTNPYTGVTVMTSPGSTVQNQSIDVVILNQPFTPFYDGNQTNQLYYNIRCKGHYEQFASDTDLGPHGIGDVQASSSSTTVVSFNIEGWGIPVGGQVDFEVQAFIGYTYYNEGECYTANVVTVGESAWSNTQTITIGNGNATSSPAPYEPTPMPTLYTNYSGYFSTPPPATPTPAPLLPGAQGGVPLVSGLNWQETALIAMAAAIAVLVGVLVSAIKWRRAPCN
jgi:hypothetical protein